MRWNARSFVAIVLTATVCTVIIGAGIGALLDRQSPNAAAFTGKMFELVTYLLGMIGGWLLRGETKPPDPPK